MADWEEIKRLAADLQRAQLSGAVQRLSERNCIEIVQRLVELGRLEVIHTTDGKEYLTPNELAKEIREELIVQGGRVNLVDIQQALNVDYSLIEAKVNDLVKSDRGLTLVLGQLIDRTYIDSLAEEINDKLQENGTVTIAELAKLHDLPGDFIKQIVRARLSHAVKGRIDEADQNVIYTDAFVGRHRSKIRGLLSATTKPVPIQVISSRCGLPVHLFHSILDDLMNSGQLAGSLTGGRQEKAIYIPTVFTKAQEDWVDSFFKQNGYIEYDAVERLGIVDAKSYLKRRFKNENIDFLGSCCVGRLMRDQLESEVDDALSTNSWTDVLPLMPSVCTPSDANQLLASVMRTKPKALILCDSVIMSEAFVNASVAAFEPLINAKAEQAVKENPALLMSRLAADRSQTASEAGSQGDHKKDQRRKKATAGKSGGGTQGREVKTKSMKKKSSNREKGANSESDDEDSHVTSGRRTDQDFMSRDEIVVELKKQPALSNCPEHLIETIASRIQRPLAQQYSENLKSVYLQTVQSPPGVATKKKSRGDVAEKIAGLWVNAKLFEKSLKLFNDDLQVQLHRYLLKTIGTDLTNAVFNIYAADVLTAIPEDKDLTPEMRSQIFAAIYDEKTKSILTNLNKSLGAKTIDDLFTYCDAICGPGFLDISLRKPDKKKERQLVFNHRQSLADQLRQETDAALILHIATVLVVEVQTQCMIHAPGRCVPLLIEFLQQHIPNDQHALLLECQEFVVKHLKKSIDTSASTAADVTSADDLQTLLSKVKNIALNAKRSATSAQADDA